MLYIYTIEYYSIMRKEDILLFLTTWINFEHIMVSEIKKVEKDKDRARWALL